MYKNQSHPSSSTSTYLGESLLHPIFLSKECISNAINGQIKCFKFQILGDTREQTVISKYFLHGKVIDDRQILLHLLFQIVCEPKIIEMYIQIFKILNPYLSIGPLV